MPPSSENKPLKRVADADLVQTTGRRPAKRLKKVKKVVYERIAVAHYPRVRDIDIKVVNNEDGTVTKYVYHGCDAIKREWNVARRVQEIGVPVPHLLEVGHEAGNEFHWLKMKAIDGRRLDQVWKRMSHEERISIAKQVARIVEVLRTVRQLDDRVCDWDGGHLVPNATEYDASRLMFANDEWEFGSNLVMRREFPQPHSEFSLMAKLPTNSRIMLTHGDLKEENIFVKDGKITAVVSWKYSGMFPEWFEYVQLMHRAADSTFKSMVAEQLPVRYEKAWQACKELFQYQIRRR